MTQLSVYGGLFSDPPLISTDGDPKRTDPYDKMDTIPSRYLGKGMSIGRSGTGQNAEVYFDKKYLTLASPEQNGNKDLGAFEDADTRMRREAMESKKRTSLKRCFFCRPIRSGVMAQAVIQAAFRIDRIRLSCQGRMIRSLAGGRRRP
ncbi:hypothetical protein TcCL_NonESM01119 [Trypanosoma cruzi]|nr:hypothetical protein TcCL_NonESM01119 [Trypanosoma cruzi]